MAASALARSIDDSTMALATADDVVLVRRSSAGDLGAFEALISRYRNDLHAFASRFHEDAFDRDDLVQETMIKAWQHIGGFGEQSSVRTWLYRIVANTAIDGYRRRRRQPSLVADESCLDGLSASPEGRVVDQHQLRWALAMLPSKYRVVTVLADRLGYPHAEIAALCHIPEATVRTRLRRARHALRVALTTDTD